MNKRKYIEEIHDDIAYGESSLDNFYSAPLTEGGMDYLARNINEITFFEDRINDDLEDMDILEGEDPVVIDFFKIKK